MSGDVHVRFWESAGVRLPRATHLPLYRQEDILARHGIEIPRSTMWGWMSSCAWLLRPLYERMKELLLQSKVIKTDDTPVPVLDPKRGKTRQGRIWVYVGDQNHPYTVYDYTPTRSRDGPAKFFGDYAGYIQADAYGGYDHLFLPRADGKPSPTEVGCWAHARRYFVESERTDALRSCTAVAMIRLLYDVEDEARPLTSEHRYELRQEKSLPRLEPIKAWLDEQKPAVLPKSPIAEAVGYCLNHWEALLRYTEDGDLDIDNNASENALRLFALGRKSRVGEEVAPLAPHRPGRADFPHPVPHRTVSLKDWRSTGGRFAVAVAGSAPAGG